MFQTRNFGRFLFLSVLMSLGCSQEDTRTEESALTINAPLTQIELVKQIDRRKSQGSLYSFDLKEKSANATVLGLGFDAEIFYDGTFQLFPTTTGEAKTWTYELDAPKIGR